MDFLRKYDVSVYLYTSKLNSLKCIRCVYYPSIRPSSTIQKHCEKKRRKKTYNTTTYTRELLKSKYNINWKIKIGSTLSLELPSST